jgi:hypothetical protein
MKLEIYEDGPKMEETIRLRLVVCGDGIAVHVVDCNGKTAATGRLLMFGASGTIRRTASVGGDFGFQRDESGRVYIA